MFTLLWNAYSVFALVAAIYIAVTILWPTKPCGLNETFIKLKDWLFGQLHINKFNIRIEQILLLILLIWPVTLAGIFYLLISVVVKQKDE